MTPGQDSAPPDTGNATRNSPPITTRESWRPTVAAWYPENPGNQQLLGPNLVQSGPGPAGLYGRWVHTRVTGVLVEDGRILLLDQDTDGPRVARPQEGTNKGEHVQRSGNQPATGREPPGTGLDPDLGEVARRETLLLQPQTRSDTKAVHTLLHPDFVEFGASGRVWDITTVAALIDPARIEATDLQVTRLAPDIALVTYLSHHNARPACRRSSIWTRHPDRGWLLRFHQGTPTR